MPNNISLGAAKAAKQDEFYTQLSDIENELRHYRKHFKGAVVFCNCDDPFESNFFKFFALNFNRLGLKKLMATCYVDSPIAGNQLSLFDLEVKEEVTKHPHKIEITCVDDVTGDGAFDLADVEYLIRNDENVLTELHGNGDFRSDECKELMAEADIVCTNPPFSLFREYVAQLMDMRKKFLIIGNMNAIHYKEIFPLLRDNKIWTGYKPFSGGMNMIVPDKVFNPDVVRHYRVNETGEKIVNVMGVIWFTNLDIQKRHEWLDLFKPYKEDNYNHYDNLDGIDVESLAATMQKSWECQTPSCLFIIPSNSSCSE